MIDVNALLPILSQFGPWGLALAAGIMWLRARNGGPLVPAPKPKPDPLGPDVPAPLQPAPDSGGTPLLDALLLALRKRFSPAQRFESLPATKDIDSDEALALLNKLLK